MPDCYTCGEVITFDKTILSPNGKQIPLWPDKKDAHSHDDNGKPIRKPIPNQGLNAQQTQQFNQYNRVAQPYNREVKSPTTGYTASTSNTQSQGGSYMDTKRLRVMVEDLTKQVNELEMKLESHVIIDSNRYENQMQIIYQKLGPLMDSTLTAAEMYKQKQQKQNPAEVRGWNSVESGERQDLPVEKTLTDDNDDQDNDEGVKDL
jgi:hypothetical protein